MTTETTTQEPAVQQGLPQFPRLTGPLGDLIEAITPDIPYEHKALSVLTYMGLAISGLTQLSGGDYDNLQPRFYSCLIGPPKNGKSAASNEVKRALKGVGKVHVQGSLSSGPALVKALERLKPNPRMLYMPDEASGAFDKAKAQRSLMSEFLHLLEDTEAEWCVSDDKAEVKDAQFAMILTATPGGFADMWTGTRGASSGLQSRFVLSFSNATMPEVKTGNNTVGIQLAVEKLQQILAALPVEIILPEKKGDFTRGITKGLMSDGVRVDGASPRVVDMAKRFALVYAACSGKTHIDDETMHAAAEFINYQIAAFEQFMPTDASSPTQRLENRIRNYFLNPKHGDKHTFREVRLWITPQESQGGFGLFKKAFDNLVNTKELVQCGSNRSGYPLFRLNPDLNDRDPHPTVPTVGRS